jgi:hypothetical protein
MPDPHDEDKIAGAPPANLDNSTILPAAGSVPWPPLVLFGLLQRLFGPPSARSIVERLLQFFVAQSPLIAGAPRKTVQFSSKLRHREKRMKIPLLVTLVGLAISFTSCSPTSGYNGRIQGASGPGSVGTNPSQRGIYPGNPNGAGRGFFFALGNGQSIAP